MLEQVRGVLEEFQCMLTYGRGVIEYVRGLLEVCQRYGRDVVEMWQKRVRGVVEGGRGVLEAWQRCGRDMVEYVSGCQ